MCDFAKEADAGDLLLIRSQSRIAVLIPAEIGRKHGEMPGGCWNAYRRRVAVPAGIAPSGLLLGAGKP
jgi:hypothetical protein